MLDTKQIGREWVISETTIVVLMPHLQEHWLLCSVPNVTLLNLDNSLPDKVQRLAVSSQELTVPHGEKIKQDAEKSTSTASDSTRWRICFLFHSQLSIKPHGAELISVLDLQTKLGIFRKKKKIPPAQNVNFFFIFLFKRKDVQIPPNSALTAERYSLASQRQELPRMPKVRRTNADVSQGGTRPSHAGAEKRDKLCVTLGKQTAPAATLRSSPLALLGGGSGGGARCEVSGCHLALWGGAAGKSGFRAFQCCWMCLGTPPSSERNHTKGGLLRFSRGQKDVSVPPSFPFTQNSGRSRREEREWEQNRLVLIFRMSIQAQSDRRLRFYTHRGRNCLRISEKKKQMQVFTPSSFTIFSQSKILLLSSPNDSQPKKKKHQLRLFSLLCYFVFAEETGKRNTSALARTHT